MHLVEAEVLVRPMPMFAQPAQELLLLRLLPAQKALAVIPHRIWPDRPMLRKELPG